MSKPHMINKIAYAIRVQLIVLIIFIVLSVLGYLHLIPNSIELLHFFIANIQKFGIPLIFVASLFENAIGINTYFPGAIVIFSGMAITKGNLMAALLTFLAIYCSTIVANCINFFIGKYAASKIKEDKPKVLWVFMAKNLWHPYLASIASFKLGFSNVSFHLFFFNFVAVSFFWNLFWGIIAYHFGGLLTSDPELFIYLFIIYLFVWITKDVYAVLKRELHFAST
jgi:membrane protein DedA with SNARE-associated domain